VICGNRWDDNDNEYLLNSISITSYIKEDILIAITMIIVTSIGGNIE
jgi:hypothetical protein